MPTDHQRGRPGGCPPPAPPPQLSSATFCASLAPCLWEVQPQRLCSLRVDFPAQTMQL